MTMQVPPPEVIPSMVTLPEFFRTQGTRLPQEKLFGEVKQFFVAHLQRSGAIRHDDVLAVIFHTVARHRHATAVCGSGGVIFVRLFVGVLSEIFAHFLEF